MLDSKLKNDKKKVDTKEFEIPETVFIRDIENTVFQSIVLQCLSQIEGISPVEGNFIDHLLGRNAEGAKGIFTEQDAKNHLVHIRVEVNIFYGIVIPLKAEEIQLSIANEITKLTGLHVSSVHVIFKNVISSEQTSKLLLSSPFAQGSSSLIKPNLGDEYGDEF